MSDLLYGTAWQGASAEKLAGDASARQYWRLRKGTDTAILMRDPGGDIPAFVRIAAYLADIGLSAPHILAQSQSELLLEDLGDALYSRICAAAPDRERPLYLAATDVLIVLHSAAPADGLQVGTPRHLARMIAPAFDWYALRATDAPQDAAKETATEAMEQALHTHAPDADVTILRDYHAENLIWLPQRDGPARTGLLDFQDAMTGHRAYDLVSLIRDARRDVTAPTAEACIARYCAATNTPPAAFGRAIAVLGLQRNLRILGIFARLAATQGKPHYVDLIPRVWAHIHADAAHPAMAPLRPIVDSLPEPGPAVLQRLKTPCPTP